MGLGTPYLSTTLLFNAPSGVSWSVIPNPDSSEAEQQAAATDIIWRSVSRIDTYCHMPLRATADTEYLNGPGLPRCNVDRDTGTGVLNMRRWPVTEVLAIQISPARSFPRAWSPVPAGNWDIRHPLIYSGDSASATAPDGGWTIDVAPGYISWDGRGRGTAGSWSGGGGRASQRVQVCYINGWPHTSLTAMALEGATVLNVDDVTGWADASGFAYDGSATEALAVSSVSAAAPLVLPNDAGTAQAGPGTITLTAPLAYEHQKGTLISALPATVIEAAIYAACLQALDAGIDAIAVQSIGGERVSSDQAVKDIAAEMAGLLNFFRRVM
jgi:hypothetical protein